MLNQRYANLEYIVIDGGSTDCSVEIIKKYSKHLTYWVSEKDSGQSHAINKGLRRATGDIVNWLNSDDYYEPHTLSLIAQAFETPTTTVVSGRSRVFRREGETVGYTKGVDIYPGNLAKSIGWARLDQPETFYRTDVIKKIGLLNENMHYIMDRDWWIRYLFNFGSQGIKQIPDMLVNFRLHETSKTVAQRENFQVEHDSLYYVMAKSAGLFSYSKFIKEACLVNENINFVVELHWNKTLIEPIVNYFLLLRANEFYAQNDKAKAQQLLDNINLPFLLPEDTKLWKKLNFRNKYIPDFIIKLLRKA